MPAGLPCIASKHAVSTLELIDDGVNVFHADFANLEDTASRMLYLADHPHGARHMGAAARDKLLTMATVPAASLAFLRGVQGAMESHPQLRQ